MLLDYGVDWRDGCLLTIPTTSAQDNSDGFLVQVFLASPFRPSQFTLRYDHSGCFLFHYAPDVSHG